MVWNCYILLMNLVLVRSKWDTSINIFETMPDCNLQIQKVVRAGLRAGADADAGAPMLSTPPALPALAAPLERPGQSRAKWPTIPQ